MNSNKTQNKNVAKKYMPIKKITKARQLKILDFLKLKQSPFTPSQNKKNKQNTTDWWEFNNKKLKTHETLRRKLKKERTAKARRNKYQTNISFDVVKKYEVDGETRYDTFRVDVPRDLTFKQTKDMKPVYKEAMETWGEIHEYAKVNQNTANAVHTPFVVIRYQPKNKIMKTKMKRITCARESLIDFKGGRDIANIDKGESECVIDYLVHTFNNPDKKSHRIRKLTRENIIKLLENNYIDIKTIQDKRIIKNDKLEPKPIEQFDIKKGITTEQVLLINKHYIRRNVIGVNFDNSVFIKHQEKNLNKKVEKDIVFMVADNHFFPIEDPSVRKSLQIQTQLANNMRIKQEEPDKRDGDDDNVKKKIIRENVINPSIDELLKMTKKNVFYTDRDDLSPVLIVMMRTNQEIPDEQLYTDSTG